MRTKEQILEDVDNQTAQAPKWEQITRIHSFHTLEVWIDIRDILDRRTEQIAAAQKTILDNL